jgi:hypothetical protein
MRRSGVTSAVAFGFFFLFASGFADASPLPLCLPEVISSLSFLLFGLAFVFNLDIEASSSLSLSFQMEDICWHWHSK